MKVPSLNYFLDTIRHLRSQEEMVVYDRFTPEGLSGDEAVIGFLMEEYERESPEYPGTRPEFDPGAALWAARTTYTAAQFLLFREKGIPETMRYLPHCDAMVTPGAILSVDLCLRFLPSIMEKAREISAEDWLVPILEEHLQAWHFSGIGYPLKTDQLVWTGILTNDCIMQLYVDRVIDRKARVLAELPVLKPAVDAVLGDHTGLLWKELSITI